MVKDILEGLANDKDYTDHIAKFLGDMRRKLMLNGFSEDHALQVCLYFVRTLNIEKQ
jgi:hypothetical protein